MLQIGQQLPTTAAMEQFGAAVAHACASQAVTLFLQGDLGAGKTTLVRGFLQALGYIGKVKSPTFSFLETYQISGRMFFHFDLYRLNHPQELAAIGWYDCFDGHNTCLVEWPERAGSETLLADLLCNIQIIDEARKVSLSATSLLGNAILKRLVL